MTSWYLACECNALGSHRNGKCAQESDISQGIALGDCRCKSNLIGQKCRTCKTNTWNLIAANPDGCEGRHVFNVCSPNQCQTSVTTFLDCDCYTGGTLGGSASCHVQTGQCLCKMYVTGRRCDECKVS